MSKQTDLFDKILGLLKNVVDRENIAEYSQSHDDLMWVKFYAKELVGECEECNKSNASRAYFVQLDGETKTQAIANHINGGFESILDAIHDTNSYKEDGATFSVLNEEMEVVWTGKVTKCPVIKVKNDKY